MFEGAAGAVVSVAFGAVVLVATTEGAPAGRVAAGEAEAAGATVVPGAAVGVAGAEPGNMPHAQSTNTVAQVRVQRRT